MHEVTYSLAARLSAKKTRGVRPPSREGFDFNENYLDTITDLKSCQCFRRGICRVGPAKFRWLITQLLKIETRLLQEEVNDSCVF
jgi:hypothetical protein